MTPLHSSSPLNSMSQLLEFIAANAQVSFLIKVIIGNIIAYILFYLIYKLFFAKIFKT